MKCVQAIQDLVRKRRPYNLDELKISHCRTSSAALDSLLEMLIKESYIDKLCLQGLTFSERTMPLLCQFLRTNKHITHVDVSWNKLPAEAWRPFLKLLRENRRLKSVNMSWNDIVPRHSSSRWAYQKQILEDRKNAKKKRKLKIDINISKLTEDERRLYHREQERMKIDEHSLFVADCLNAFIKYN
jgi:hypothetical protein